MTIDNALRQAEYILAALSLCTDDNHDEQLLTMATEILVPYWEQSHPQALWLKAGMPNLGEKSPRLSGPEFEAKYAELVRVAAEGGCSEAQYQHGCNLYDQGEITEAVSFYLKAAQKDYAPAQWCYGLDVFHGNGVDKNEKIGLYYIYLAAEQRNENAVEFMKEANQKGIVKWPANPFLE